MVLDCWWWRRGLDSELSLGEMAGEGYLCGSDASCQLPRPSPNRSTLACGGTKLFSCTSCHTLYKLFNLQEELDLSDVHWSCAFLLWKRPRPSCQIETLAFCWCWAGRDWRPAGPRSLLCALRSCVVVGNRWEDKRPRLLGRKTAGCNR